MLLVRACKNPTIGRQCFCFFKEAVGPSYSEASIVEKAPHRFRSMLERRPEELF